MASKQTTMPPPGTKEPALTVAIGVGKPKSSGNGNGGPADDPQLESDPSGGPGGKASPADAHVVKADHHCKDCENWDPSSGDCSEVDGNYDAEDACIKYFEPIGSPDDDDDQSSPSAGGGASSMPPSPPSGGGGGPLGGS
jgi:hypothetical protein